LWNGHVALAKAEHCLFLSLVLQDYRIPVCAQLLVMIVIAGRLSLLGFVFKPVSWLAGDSRLRQTFSLRIHLVERQSLSSICPSTIISYLRSLEASLSTSARRSTAGPIVFSLDRNKPVTKQNRQTGQDRIANCRCRTSHRESRAAQDAGGTFHRKWRSRRDLIDLRGCQGWKPLVHLGLPSLRCSKNSGNLRR